MNHLKHFTVTDTIRRVKLYNNNLDSPLRDMYKKKENKNNHTNILITVSRGCYCKEVSVLKQIWLKTKQINSKQA